jgi:hypothetical protein
VFLALHISFFIVCPLCTASQRLWWLAESAYESTSHALGIAEAGAGRYSFDWLCTTFHTFAGGFQPQPLDRLCGGHASLGDKRPREMSRAHCSTLGKSLDRKALVQPFPSPRKDW